MLSHGPRRVGYHGAVQAVDRRRWAGYCLSWGLTIAAGCTVVDAVPGEESSTGEDETGTPTTGVTTMTTALPDGTADDTTGDPTGTGTGCCEPHGSAGCDEPPVEACVCELSAFCCQFEWDAACAALAVDECGGCGQGDSDTGTDTDTVQCCDVADTPGCADPTVEMCVCAFDPFCCETQWDQQCIDESVSDCGAGCTVTPPPPDDCCSPGRGGGCDIEDVETCVCDQDASCCETVWDGVCVALGVTACDNRCPGLAGSGGDCCAEHDGTGCDDPFVTACACALDEFCCGMNWDGLCVESAALNCGSGCPVDFGPCCEPNATPGCNDLGVVGCICDLDPFCCDQEWDAKCIDGATNFCKLDCSGSGTGTGSESGSGTGSGSGSDSESGSSSSSSSGTD